MKGVYNGVKYCNMNRTQELSNRMYQRNLPTGTLSLSYDPRPTQTKYVKMPILDCRKASTVPCKDEVIFNPYKTFTPGQTAPFSGFAADIDQESRVQSRFFPLQEGAQSKFIPSSGSDLYKVNVTTTQPVAMTHSLLFKQERFAPADMNKCGLSKKIFNNFTRLDVRNMPVRK